MLLSLAITFLSYTAILFSWAIPVDDDSGILYRFSPSSSNETVELLSWAEVRYARKIVSIYESICLQLREWDLWQMSHSYVDVHFPGRAIAEAELGHLPFELPSTSHRLDTDGRTSSCTQGSRAKHAPSCSPMADAAVTRWDVASPSNATFHARYHPLDEIESFVRDLAAAYPQQVAVVPLGHSGEGREMFALEISSAAAGASAGARDGSHDQNSRQVVLDGMDGKGKEERGAGPRCGFLVTGAQHAREVSFVYIFASPPSALCLALSENGAHWFIAAVVGCLFFRVVHRTRPPSRPVGDIFSRPFT